ncbi:MAG: Transcription termination protein NusB [Firmicutes bacterium]|nr:Transcription termination protein NusB [Bacillota bacterium]MDI6705393.1 transcription antitermination factor NusB [Bacillota bacterium]
MSRKLAREMAVKFLFQMEARGEDYRDMVDDFLEDNPLKEGDERFFRDNIEGTVANLKEIDGLIERKLVNWTISRIPKVNLAVLRNAIYELMYREDIPVSVSINEAVDLAKRFGDEESGVFVNGILGTLVRDREISR